MREVRVILVDDNAEFLAVLKAWLAAEPSIQIIGATTSVHEAIAQVCRENPELVLMDLNMPEMNGLDATRLLKGLPNAPDVVIVTMEDSEEVLRAVAASGANGFVAKSALAEQLLPLLRRMYE